MDQINPTLPFCFLGRWPILPILFIINPSSYLPSFSPSLIVTHTTPHHAVASSLQPFTSPPPPTVILESIFFRRLHLCLCLRQSCLYIFINIFMIETIPILQSIPWFFVTIIPQPSLPIAGFFIVASYFSTSLVCQSKAWSKQPPQSLFLKLLIFFLICFGISFKFFILVLRIWLWLANLNSFVKFEGCFIFLIW